MEYFPINVIYKEAWRLPTRVAFTVFSKIPIDSAFLDE